MTEENISQGFKLREIDEIRNFLLEKIKHIYLESKKHKKRVVNYIKHLFVLVFAVNGCVSISAFASLVGIPIGFASSAAGLNICAITSN